jgi:hypothetical protein
MQKAICGLTDCSGSVSPDEEKLHFLFYYSEKKEMTLIKEQIDQTFLALITF